MTLFMMIVFSWRMLKLETIDPTSDGENKLWILFDEIRTKILSVIK